METILLTGGAGFIGSHLAEALLASGQYRVICLDNLDDFYPVELKKENLRILEAHPEFRFLEEDIASLDEKEVLRAAGGRQIDRIIHLAAKAGVRPSIHDPVAYYRTNVDGTVRLLEFARRHGVGQFVYGSSSSVYGNHPEVPWTETLADLSPISPYAATKLAGEQLGQVYAHLYPLRFTALRLFTVYGPRQRPDLAIHKFYRAMRRGERIDLYGDGSTSRDYTFVGDLVQGILAALTRVSREKHAVFNLGSGRPVSLLEMVRALERVTGIQANVRFAPEQPGDVSRTWADISKASTELGYHPRTSLEEGIRAFAAWKESMTSIVY